MILPPCSLSSLSFLKYFAAFSTFQTQFPCLTFFTRFLFSIFTAHNIFPLLSSFPLRYFIVFHLSSLYYHFSFVSHFIFSRIFTLWSCLVASFILFLYSLFLVLYSLSLSYYHRFLSYSTLFCFVYYVSRFLDFTTPHRFSFVSFLSTLSFLYYTF